MEDYDAPADLGGVTIGKLIDKHEKDKLSNGLSSLLNLGPKDKSIKVTKTKTLQFDSMVMNEILRVVREKNDAIESRFDKLEIQILNLKRFDSTDKKFLISIAVACILIGIIFGQLLNYSQNEVSPIIVNKIDDSQIKNNNFMVTKKFVNLRVSHSPRAKKILTIAPAQQVQVLKRKGGWAQVKYHNKLSGKKFIGHVWDEYLTTIKP